MRYLTAFLLLTFMSTAQAHDLDDLQGQIDELRSRVEALEQAPPSPDVCRVATVEPGQDPLFPHCLPGRIEAEDYDLGGEGVAYHDRDPGNRGGLYRDDQGVDIKATSDEDGEYQVGWNQPGEWLEYTVRADEGVYDIHFRVSCGIDPPIPCGQIRPVMDGIAFDTVQVPNTGGWDGPYETVVLECIPVRAGNQTLRLEMLDWLDLNWIEFVLRPDLPGNQPPCNVVLDDGS